MFTSDHMAGGTLGGQWRVKRVPHTPADLSEVGYNQVHLLQAPLHHITFRLGSPSSPSCCGPDSGVQGATADSS